MGARPATHYMNADFDLGLRPRPDWKNDAVLERQVRELTLQALLGADEGDAAMLRVPVAGAYLDYLARRGVPVPRPLLHPGIDRGSVFRPYGWSREAMALNRRHEVPEDHPAPETVERINRRSFGLALEAELFPEGPRAEIVESVDGLERLLADARPGSEWVLKAEHGNAGLANRRVGGGALSERDRRFAAGRLAEDDRLAVEPWLPRERDWCVVFEAPFAPESARIHEAVNTRDGSPVGALFEPRPSIPPDARARLEDAAEAVAASLIRAGYFGPVCMDAFTWRDGGASRLRPLVDLNCRRSLSDGPYRLWRRLCPERTVYHRFFSRRKLSFPATLDEAVEALGESGFRGGENRGVLLASPLSYGERGERAPLKLAVLFAGADRKEALSLETGFRSRFEK